MRFPFTLGIMIFISNSHFRGSETTSRSILFSSLMSIECYIFGMVIDFLLSCAILFYNLNNNSSPFLYSSLINLIKFWKFSSSIIRLSLNFHFVSQLLILCMLILLYSLDAFFFFISISRNY